jgi:hypothetical protein
MSDEPEPLTDDELAEMEVSLHWEAARAGDLEPPFVSAKLALRLVAEIRRLRSSDAGMSDPELDAIEADVAHGHAGLLGGAQLSRENSVAMMAPGGWVRRLIAEVRQYRTAIARGANIRSDEWIKRAAQEIRDASGAGGTAVWAGPGESDEQVIAAIIRKHRDWKSMKLAVVGGGWGWRCCNCGARTDAAGPAGGGTLSIWLFIFEGWREARAHARSRAHDVEFPARQSIFASAPPEREWGR